jgi:hypothetical protein
MTMNNALLAVSALGVAAGLGSACGASTSAMTPDRLQQQYGITGSYASTVQTPQGSIRGTVIPVTLADGRTAQLVIPAQSRNEPHAMYIQDGDGIHPVQLDNSVTREQLVASSEPRVVGRRVETAHAHKRSWEKDALIIGGSAGGGALIGALAKGKKGAGVGAAAGGIGGLIYDLVKK